MNLQAISAIPQKSSLYLEQIGGIIIEAGSASSLMHGKGSNEKLSTIKKSLPLVKNPDNPLGKS